jgi:tetratricopeptide (TPR) repeat protein
MDPLRLVPNWETGSILMSKVKLALLPICTIILIAFSYIALANERSEVIVPQSIAFNDEARLAQPAANQPNADKAIAFWQKRVAENPKAYLEYTLLGEAYARKARETGDVGYYQRAEAALRRSLEINPNYLPTSALLSGVLFAMHDFEGALSMAEPLANSPAALQAMATLGDTYLALGSYEKAKDAYQKLLSYHPGPAVSSRLAILTELGGDSDRALLFMQEAADLARQAGDEGESLAWYEYQVGELQFRSGRLHEAEAQFKTALDTFPNYHLALAGLGKIRAAQGDYQAAIELYQQATAIIPQPDFLAALGDVYTVAGQLDKAKLQYDTVEYIGKLAEINQQIYNRQLANFYADHNLHLPEALKLAISELQVRQDIYGYDAAAWAYYKNGQFEQAQAMIEQAMKLGTRDAKLYYHAGMIAHALGDRVEAERLLTEAMMINPYFDLRQARIAQTTLKQLSPR